jgi:hypothetical protein
MEHPERYVHLTVRALPGTLLFHDWTEALALWRRLEAAFPDAKAMCLMPNHAHLVTAADGAVERLRGVMSGYARWRNRRRGQEGAAWQELQPSEPIPDEKHLRRTIRYVLLNPCRAELAVDPLAWPLSNHSDLVGLGRGSGRRDAENFHAYVSSDPTVAPSGTCLPVARRGRARLGQVEAAVGALWRLQPHELASWVGRSASTVRKLVASCPARHAPNGDRRLLALLRAIGDERFQPLRHSLRANPTRWSGWKQG